jgi:hypothetical protein
VVTGDFVVRETDSGRWGQLRDFQSGKAVEMGVIHGRYRELLEEAYATLCVLRAA